MPNEPDPIPPISRWTQNFKLNLHERKMREWTKTLNINFEILDRIVGKLVPPPPSPLSSLTPTLLNAYTAKQAVSGTQRSTVVDNTRPTVEVDNFFDGDSGTVTAFVDGQSVGSRILSETNDAGTYGSLTIVSDSDPYANIPGKENFYKQVKARFTSASVISVGGTGHTFQLKHSLTGDSGILNVWVDNPVIPVIPTNSPSIAKVVISPKIVNLINTNIAVSAIVSNTTTVGTYTLYYNNLSGMHSLSLQNSSFQQIDSITRATWSTTWTTSNGITFTLTPSAPVTNQNQSIVVNTGTTPPVKYVSGIPVLTTGNKVSIAFNVNSAVSEFYNATRVARVESTVINSIDVAPASTPYGVGDTIPVNVEGTIIASAFASPAVFKLIGYNSKGVLGFINHQTNLRIDSKSDESQRLKSGAGQFPTKGPLFTQFGNPFDATESLTLNEELQLEGGVYKFPQAVDYSTYGGPDYRSVTGGTYDSYRWLTLNLGSITDVNGLTITFQNPVNFGTAVRTSGLKLYVRVDGATGWLDGSTSFQGAGSPSANGDAALVFANSSASVKRITFGPTVRSGVVYVRVGIAEGSPISFTGIVRS